MATVFVTGATGFIGTHVCRALVDAGYNPVGLTRQLPPQEKRVDGTRYVQGDVTDASTLFKAIPTDCQAVVHLVGIITENKSKKQTFERVHVDGTRNVVQAAQSAGLTSKAPSCFVYVSAQGASLRSTSRYSRTKAQAEEIVQASGIPFTLLRPSLVLGLHGEFVQQMEQLIRRPPLSPVPLPFVPVPGNGHNRFQPVWVKDLARAIVATLQREESRSQTIPVGGRDAVTFDTLLHRFQRRLGTRKPLLHIPFPFLFAAATVLERVLPSPPITGDQLINLRVDNVTDNEPLQNLLGVFPLGFEQILDEIYGSQNRAPVRSNWNRCEVVE